MLSYQTCVTFPFLYYLLTLCCFINFCRLIKLLSYYRTLAIVGFRTFFIGVYISLMISQDIPSCETFSRVDCLKTVKFHTLKTSHCKQGKNADSKKYTLSVQCLHRSRIFYVLKFNTNYCLILIGPT